MQSNELESPIPCPSSWTLTKLSDICKKIGSGATPRGGQAAYQAQRTNFSLIRSQNIFDRNFSMAGLAFISDEQAIQLKGVWLEEFDVLINITGDGVTFGRVCTVPKNVLPACVNQHVSIIRVDKEKAFPGYVSCFLSSQEVKPYIESFNAGGSRRAITKGHIESFIIPLPPYETQVAIAEFLDALDDRITLLRETNATLEAMAQALFKSWFVDFDPVHAKLQGHAPEGMDAATAALFPDSLEESELGMVPKGWTPARLDSFVELAYGKALKAEARIAGDVPVYGSGGVTGWHNVALVNEPSIVVGRKGTVGSLYWENRPFFPIDTVFFVKTKKPLSYVFQVLNILGLKDMNTDAAVPGLSRENAYRLLVAGVPDAAITAFDVLASSFRESVVHNSRKIESLEALRDTLLPRLISGQLRLPEAQVVVQATAPSESA